MAKDNKPYVPLFGVRCLAFGALPPASAVLLRSLGCGHSDRRGGGRFVGSIGLHGRPVGILGLVAGRACRRRCDLRRDRSGSRNLAADRPSRGSDTAVYRPGATVRGRTRPRHRRVRGAYQDLAADRGERADGAAPAQNRRGHLTLLRVRSEPPCLYSFSDIIYTNCRKTMWRLILAESIVRRKCLAMQPASKGRARQEVSRAGCLNIRGFGEKQKKYRFAGPTGNVSVNHNGRLEN